MPFNRGNLQLHIDTGISLVDRKLTMLARCEVGENTQLKAENHRL